MRAALTVLAKEVTDNFRDRRSLLSSLFFGPLLGPAVFALMLTLIIEGTDAEEPLEMPVVGAEHAPNLVAFLRQHNVEAPPPPDDPTQAVRDGIHDVVLVVPESFAADFRAGLPARLQLVADRSNQRTGGKFARAQALLGAYGDTLAAMRLKARGISTFVIQPLVIEDVDVSTPTGRSVLVLGVFTYFLLFAVLAGGMYLATDATAGERERGSLEPLLTLPVERGVVIVGKIGATVVYMALSLVITVVLFSLVVRLVPLERLGMSVSFGPAAVIATVLVMLPFTLVGAGLMTVVASFTRTYKEAQTYLSLMLLVPTLPILVSALKSQQPSLALMAVPSLSQHLLVTELLKNEPVQPAWVAVSVLSTLGAGAALVWLATRLYRREHILG